MTPEELKQVRLDKGLTQETMARLLGLKKHGGRSVRRFETGELKPSGSTLRLYTIIAGRKLKVPKKKETKGE